MKFPKRLRHRGKGRVLVTIYRVGSAYRVYWRARVDGVAKSRMRDFLSYAEAKREGDKLVMDLAKGRGATLSPGQLADALNALEELHRFQQATGKKISIRYAVGEFCEAAKKLGGHTLAEATDGFLGTVATVKRMDLAAAVEQFVAQRKLKTIAKDGKRSQLSPSWHYILSMWLREFARTFPNHAVCDLSRNHLTQYVNSHNQVSARTRNGRRNSVKMFLKWSVERDYLSANHRLLIADGMVKETQELGDVEFYRPKELRALLDCASEQLKFRSLLPVVALGGLGGLRLQEIVRLTWADVWRVPQHVEITATKSKTRQRRLVEMVPALQSWLEPFRDFTGDVWPKLIQNAPESFDDPRAGQVAAAVLVMRRNGEPVSFAALFQKLEPLKDFITSEISQAATTMANDEGLAQECWQAYQIRRVKSVAADMVKSLESDPKHAPAIIENARCALDLVISDATRLAERIKDRIFSPDAKPTEPEPRFSIAGTQICTPGNLTTISSPPKAGKSAVIGAMLASVFAVRNADCLGFSAQNPNGLAVIKIDTEQSKFDHWDGTLRAIRRAQVTAAPDWLWSYYLTGFPADDIRAAMSILVAQAKKHYGGIHSVFVDGTADAVHDVNDPAETSSLITNLQSLAIEFDCPIINVIHINPGSDFKTRGHLGPQLERKSETNLRLEKDEMGISVIWADKNRRAPIPKSTAPRFAWDKESGMHIACDSLRRSKDEAEKQTLKTEAHAVFTAAGKDAIRYGQFTNFLMSEVHASKSTAKRHFDQMIEIGIVHKELTGLYTLNA